MIEVWHIRHGESEANAGQATERPELVGLTKLGNTQATNASLTIDKAPNLIITSKYKRAIETAQPTAKRFPKVPIEEWNIHEFTYLSPVMLGNTTQQERKPLSQAYWEKCDPNFIHGEGAESFSAFIGRVRIMQEQLRKIENGFIIVFSHGFVIKLLIWANLVGAFNISSEYMRNFYGFHKSFDLPNCAIIKSIYHPDKILDSGIITDHLKGSIGNEI